jgi:hypothetical protein
MINANLRSAVILGLAFGAAGISHAQVRESVGAPVPAQGGAASIYASNVPVPAGTILVDEYSGRFITHPTGGSGGAPASALQTALAMTSYGAGSQISANNWVAEDFTVPAQGWAINQVRFYTYQTGATTTSTINDLRIQIFSGTPGGTPVFGDATTNRLTSTTFSTVYRVLDTGLTDTARPIFEVVAQFSSPVNLTTPGTYWIAWSLGGTLASGPWTPPQTVLGQITTGNCMQSVGGAAYAAFVDGGTTTAQGCPFVLEGATLPVQLQSFGID